MQGAIGPDYKREDFVDADVNTRTRPQVFKELQIDALSLHIATSPCRHDRRACRC